MERPRVSTGIKGLDEVLGGGLLAGQAYLVRGGPGMGKTTFGFHFLSEGVARGETCLLITLGESQKQLCRNAEALGLNLDNVEFLDFSPTAEFFTQVQTYDIFSPAEVERDPIAQQIIECVTRSQPQRIFLDAMTQFRYLAADEFQFRKQVLSLLRFLVEQNATVTFTSEGYSKTPDDDLQFMSDGVIQLESTSEGRKLSISKFRGSDFRSGNHALHLTDQGMEVFPRLLPGVYKRDFALESVSSGIPELDELLQGGVERGTATIISGPSGVGKSTLGLQFMKEAAGRGERSAIYVFEEAVETLLHRCEAVNIPARIMRDRGTLSVVSVEPLEYSPDRFACMVREEVEKYQTKIVMIDSTSGYSLSIRGNNLIPHIHALCQYLRNMGVTTILINEVETISGGDFQATEIGLSYLADNIIFLRYVEFEGQLRKAIGVLKKRMSDYERHLRAFEVTRYGLKVGEPLRNLRRILSGSPELCDSPERPHSDSIVARLKLL
jgi:circadian clock protein KaiC